MTRFASMLACAALGLVGGLAAQRPSPRGGFWYSVGLANGWARVSCDICRREHEPGLSASLRLGGRVSQSVLIGADLAAWRKGGNGVDQTLTSVGAAAFWYPRRRSLYLKGGIGYVSHRIEDGTDVITSSGLGPQMGIGYEVRLGRALFLTPYFSVAYGVIASGVKFNGAEIVDQATVTLVQLGVAIAGH